MTTIENPLHQIPIRVDVAEVGADEQLRKIAIITADAPFEMMRAGNLALPDADPRKITRSDIGNIRYGANCCEMRGDPSAFQDLLNIAAKLEALLQPE